MMQKTEITQDMLLAAYSRGFFPMAESQNATEIFWVDPEVRGILPLDAFHLPRRLARTIRQSPLTIRINTAFEQVIEQCAAPRASQKNSGTWINREIRNLYCALHDNGLAHSVECWLEDELAGGLYGVSQGAAFFGESMFSLTRDASKTALVYLVARLLRGGYCLLDTQFNTSHLQQFGAIDVPRDTYKRLLRQAIARPASFYSLPADVSASEILQSVSQAS